MPIDFDDDDISGVIEDISEKPVAQKPSVAENFEEDSFEEEMDEAEARLEMAQYYKLIMDNPMFDDVPNESVAQRVEQEIRSFVKQRMKILVGLEAKEPKAKQQFSEQELVALKTLSQPEVFSALKALAARLLKKPEILDVQPVQQEKAPQKQEKVIKEPILRKVGRRNKTKDTPISKPTSTSAEKNSGKPRPVKETVMVKNSKGELYEKDITKPSLPEGPIQPVKPPASKAALEFQYQSIAERHAASALSSLEKKLTGR